MAGDRGPPEQLVVGLPVGRQRDRSRTTRGRRAPARARAPLLPSRSTLLLLVLGGRICTPRPAGTAPPPRRICTPRGADLAPLTGRGGRIFLPLDGGAGRPADGLGEAVDTGAVGAAPALDELQLAEPDRSLDRVAHGPLRGVGAGGQGAGRPEGDAGLAGALGQGEQDQAGRAAGVRALPHPFTGGVTHAACLLGELVGSGVLGQGCGTGRSPDRWSSRRRAYSA